MKILFIISSLNVGGAERVTSLLLNDWINKIDKISIVTFDYKKNDFYYLDDRIHRHEICFSSNTKSFFKRVAFIFLRLIRLRSIIKKEKPDLVISFIDRTNILTILAALFTNVSVAISERGFPDYHNNGILFNSIRKLVYKFCNAFVAQTNTVKIWAEQFIEQAKISIIPNPIYLKYLAETSTLENKTILAVGRLVNEKGYDLLIKAYKECYLRHPDWQLVIVGEGSERKNLEEQIRKLNLEEVIHLVGETNSVDKYYQAASIFALSSRSEGFPNALLEAMGYGLAVVSFDCKSGPSDIIVNGENGILVPENDIIHLAKAINRLIEDTSLRKKLASEALKVKETYNIEEISEKWFQLMRDITNISNK